MQATASVDSSRASVVHVIRSWLSLMDVANEWLSAVTSNRNTHDSSPEGENPVPSTTTADSNESGIFSGRTPGKRNVKYVTERG